MATTALTPAATTYRTGLYEWLTTTDHKKIGILYLINSFIFFGLGGLLALGVRAERAAAGWTSYSPLAQDRYSGTGMDLWVVAVVLIGTSSILGSINFLVTIFKM